MIALHSDDLELKIHSKIIQKMILTFAQHQYFSTVILAHPYLWSSFQECNRSFFSSILRVSSYLLFLFNSILLYAWHGIYYCGGRNLDFFQQLIEWEEIDWRRNTHKFKKKKRGGKKHMPRNFDGCTKSMTKNQR